MHTLLLYFYLIGARSDDLVSESILTTQLCQVLRVIFYYNPRMVAATGCYPEDLALALSTKLFLLVEGENLSIFLGSLCHMSILISILIYHININIINININIPLTL
jgi:hypothetical protein